MGMRPLSDDYLEELSAGVRGFTVPVVYSLFGAPSRAAFRGISLAQSAAWALGWLALAWRLSGLGRGAASVAGLAALLPFAWAAGYWQSVNLRLSDAFGFSLAALFAALCVAAGPALAAEAADCGAAARARGILRRGVFVLAFAGTALLSLRARDTNVLAGACALPLAATAWRARGRVSRGWTAACLALAAGAFVAGTRPTHIARRIPMGHIVASLGLCDDELFEWFVADGAPLVPADRRLCPMDEGEPLARFVGALPRLFNPAFGDSGGATFPGDFASPLLRAEPALADWLGTRAQRSWALFLATHPLRAAALVADGGDIALGYEFARPVGRVDALAGSIPSADALAALLAAVLGAAVWLRGRQALADRMLAAGAVLAAGGMATAVASYLGDVWETAEMGRHALQGAIFLRAGLALALAAAATSALSPVLRRLAPPRRD